MSTNCVRLVGRLSFGEFGWVASKLRGDVLNRLPQFGFYVDSFLDSLCAMVDGCMRLAERATDFDERTRGELAGEEHCHLTRRDERLRAFL